MKINITKIHLHLVCQFHKILVDLLWLCFWAGWCFQCWSPAEKIKRKNIDFFDKNNKINHIKIGNFLGYECVHDIVKDKPCTKGYALEIVYNDDKKSNLQVYAFCCIKLTINVINKLLKKINKMNYYIRKYLSDKLKGQIQLNLENQKYYSP